ncbi:MULTISPECIES: hypothetical protein [Commensalibacter]|uniref:Uncharacterized protein n=2 Tax=Commensalibacter TaxID=1079922 RepID=W7DV20_9PROT|nr:MULTISPECIES: hypothetical protein [Commensalibacter]EUK18860.1 hypothetical protein COMX_03900 [Commensalibacter papalotli (ex Servin-Garciduenas et al. 2014)]CAI3925282.1 unnamed protein product [Commensalibacter papalotli (ex Botero et al. 2024)]CAI3926814.1 unnamed protein product [Commensalibacter papalotli (ex Botero et al. 2024)]
MQTKNIEIEKRFDGLLDFRNDLTHRIFPEAFLDDCKNIRRNPAEEAKRILAYLETLRTGSAFFIKDILFLLDVID